MLFCRLWFFFFKLFSNKIFQEYHQRVKQFGCRSCPTFCRAWSGSKLFAKRLSADDQNHYLCGERVKGNIMPSSGFFFFHQNIKMLSATVVISTLRVTCTWNLKKKKKKKNGLNSNSDFANLHFNSSENKKIPVLSKLGKSCSRQHSESFYLFYPENRLDIACKLSPNCQTLFAWKNKKYQWFVVCWICPESDEG